MSRWLRESMQSHRLCIVIGSMHMSLRVYPLHDMFFVGGSSIAIDLLCLTCPCLFVIRLFNASTTTSSKWGVLIYSCTYAGSAELKRVHSGVVSGYSGSNPYFTGGTGMYLRVFRVLSFVPCYGT